MANNENMNSEEEEVIILLDEDEAEAFDEEIIEETEAEETELFKEEEVAVPIVPVVPKKTKVTKKEETEYEYEDDDDDDDEVGFLGGLGGKLLIVFGIAIAILAIVVGVNFLKKDQTSAEAVDFSQVGVNVATLGTIGGDNIGTVIDTYAEKVGDLLAVRKSFDYDEADEGTGTIPVDMTLTTILKDLKIKFVNKKNKLIANVPFKVEVTKPDGSKETIVDEDKDGIIYLSEIEGGAYKVELINLEKFNDFYDFSVCDIKSATVKTQIEYKKVDVSNEIKTADEKVTEKEDTKVAETETESKLTDTVAYVASEKISTGTSYSEIDKTTITDPATTLQTSYMSRFMKLAGGTCVGTWNYTSNGDGTHNGVCSVGGSTCTDHPAKTNEPCTNNGSGTCSVCNGTIPAACGGSLSYTPNNDGTHNAVCSVGGSSCATHPAKINEACTYNASGVCSACGYTCPHANKTYTAVTADTHKVHCSDCNTDITASENCAFDSANNNKCKYCSNVKPAASVAASGSITLDKTTYKYSSADTTQNKGKATANISFSSGGDEIDTTQYTYIWNTSDANTVKLTSRDTKEVAFEILKSGKATLQCNIGYKPKAGSTASAGEVVATLEVTVEGSVITLSHEKITVYAGLDPVTVTATATGGVKNTVTVTVDQADWKYAGVQCTDGKNILINGISAGKFNINVTSDDDASVKKTIEVTVYVHPKADTVTKLTDKNGNQVYVEKNGNKVEATYADYYTATKFYTGGGQTYKYTGWWTIDGKTYYFDSNGKKVTGDQVILGAKYSFGNDGVLKNGTGTFGIDVSTWNGSVDWGKVAKSGVSYAILRCGFRGSSAGGLYVDNKFETNIKNATSAGIKVGVYFFTQAVTEAEAVEEASMCISLVENYKISYPIFIDVESSNGRADSLSKEDRTKVIKAFCETIKSAGYTPGVYANKNWLTTKINATELTSYKIWLAQYADNVSYTTTRYDMWQYSSGGSINGISGNVDLNLSYLGF